MPTIPAAATYPTPLSRFYFDEADLASPEVQKHAGARPDLLEKALPKPRPPPSRWPLHSLPTKEAFGNFFPKTDLGQELPKPKRKLRGNHHFRVCSSSVLVPVVKSHNDGDGGLVTL
jgi:hypothetical protein